ncbi:MAG: acyltransferase [Candidatus Sericytochromatia bacterium]
MTLLSKLVSLFPLSVGLWLLASLWAVLRWPGPLTLLLPLVVVYLYPVAAFRLLNLFQPLKEGSFDLLAPRYNAWWGSHQFQLIYFACPWLEGLLRCVPGVYSAWLRLWGAKIGKAVYWTPNVEIDDRPLLDMGDQVVIGHKLHVIAHVIIPHRERLSLYVKRICIGDRCFIGAGTRLGPGVVLEDDTALPILTEGKVNQVFSGNLLLRR